MKGYIYTMFAGADPGKGWEMTDPIFEPRPSLGACMPNIRRYVSPGDHIFVISGRVKGAEQFVVGGFAVDEKISALAAYRRFPENRQKRNEGGQLSGNIIVDAAGKQNAFDYHGNFEKRLENYIVGKDPVYLNTEAEYELGRVRSLNILREIIGRPHARKISEVIGRTTRLSETQINELRHAISELKAEARNAGH